MNCRPTRRSGSSLRRRGQCRPAPTAAAAAAPELDLPPATAEPTPAELEAREERLLQVGAAARC